MSYPFRQPRRAAIRPSPIFLGVLALAVATGGYVYAVGNTLTRTTQFLAFLFVVGAWIVSLCLHEFGHAFLAWRFGDREVETRGYLTLNPLKYANWVLSLLLPVLFIMVGGIALPGGAVYLHHHYFRTKLQRSLVSLIGPAANAVLGVLLILLARDSLIANHRVFFAMVSFVASLQIMAAILNVLPIPGLDGYGAIEPYLSPQTQRSFEPVKPFGMLGLFVLLQVASLNRFFFDIIYGIFSAVGGNRSAASLGYDIMRFWIA
ncbi:site-2 protease family protein [Jatrophihabitans telluris]|uniref:Site-2 protease family protein n=1 Tax=Jatrophihabitans telluris TaxID=2038343 RepID=A0ABY4QU68_9ACTN|nr:site-2 protease family protein [Jatrophihabitans telluris]UQX86807.1 site-2 protease family protein [Jatrophihabitans telluris]